MRIAICDDSDFDRDLFADILEVYLLNKSAKYNIDKYSSGENLIYEVSEGYNYDIIFLDIYLGKELGIDIARKLREINYNGEIIIISSVADFALEGYAVSATGYILKGDSFDKLTAVMDKILNSYGTDSYRIQKRNNIILIPYQDILFISSDNTKCIIHCIDKKEHTVYKKLNEIEKELGNACFLRSHQSYLVNMNYILYTEDCYFKMINNTFVPMRIRNSKDIKQKYLHYLENKVDINFSRSEKINQCKSS